jgi:hypothetical protein
MKHARISADLATLDSLDESLIVPKSGSAVVTESGDPWAAVLASLGLGRLEDLQRTCKSSSKSSNKFQIIY